MSILYQLLKVAVPRAGEGIVSICINNRLKTLINLALTRGQLRLASPLRKATVREWTVLPLRMGRPGDLCLIVKQHSGTTFCLKLTG